MRRVIQILRHQNRTNI